MKPTRELYFEPLEKRELLASDFGHLTNSHPHRDLDGPVFGEFRQQYHSQSDSLVAFERGTRSRPLSISDRSNNTSRHIPVSFAFERPSIAIEFWSARPKTSPAEGEASSIDRSVLFRPTQPPERTILTIVLSDRLVSAPATNGAFTFITQERFIPISLRALNESSNASLVQKPSDSIALLAPHVEHSSENGRTSELLRSHRTLETHRSDQAFVDLVFVADHLPYEVSNAPQASAKVALDVPAPTGMISLGLDSGLLSHNPNMNNAKLWRKSNVGSFESTDLRREPSDRINFSVSVAKLEGGLPIPAGMISLDFATSLLSKADDASPRSRAVLQAGINPLALIQTFVNSQPIVASVQSQASNASEPNDALASNSNTLSWSSVGVIAALSGFFFAITPRRARETKSELRTKFAEDDETAIRQKRNE